MVTPKTNTKLLIFKWISNINGVNLGHPKAISTHIFIFKEILNILVQISPFTEHGRFEKYLYNQSILIKHIVG